MVDIDQRVLEKNYLIDLHQKHQVQGLEARNYHEFGIVNFQYFIYLSLCCNSLSLNIWIIGCK
jgi:hypothetical protein